MAKEKYEPPKIEILNKKDEPVDITPSHGNTRLPFGLCMRYGIAIGKDWTPRDAWDALAGKGITPQQVYAKLNGEEPAEKKKTIKERLDETAFSRFDKKQKREILNFVGTSNRDNKRLIEMLRYYRGSFGDLSSYSDEELNAIIDLAKEAAQNKEENFVYFKSGAKWKMSKLKELLELEGVKTYTEEEKKAYDESKTNTLVTKSQSEYDKKIQSMFGENTTVVFGKGYSEDDMRQITEATAVLTTEYPGLRDFVKLVGDRTNLENYVNAVKRQQKFSEDEISAMVEKIKGYYFGGLPSDERLREEAIRNLRSEIKIARMPSAYAYWQPSKRLMCFQPIMKSGGDENRQREYDNNSKSSNKKIATYYHEMGHAVDSMIEQMNRTANANVQGNYERGRELYAIQREFDRKKFELRNMNINNSGEGKKYNVSSYANTNAAEFTAECFAAHYTNMNNKICDDYVSLYKKFIEDLKGFM